MHSKRFINGKIFLGTNETAFADSLTMVDGKIAPDNAVFEPDEVIDLHGATVVPGLIGNSRALELAGIDENTPDPAGGKIEKDENGRQTGFMREVAASQLLIRAKSALSYENDVKNLVNSSEHYLENGIVADGALSSLCQPQALSGCLQSRFYA